MKPDLITIDLKELAELLKNETVNYCDICEHQNKYVACKKSCTRGISNYLCAELTIYANSTESEGLNNDKTRCNQ